MSHKRRNEKFIDYVVQTQPFSVKGYAAQAGISDETMRARVKRLRRSRLQDESLSHKRMTKAEAIYAMSGDEPDYATTVEINGRRYLSLEDYTLLRGVPWAFFKQLYMNERKSLQEAVSLGAMSYGEPDGSFYWIDDDFQYNSLTHFAQEKNLPLIMLKWAASHGLLNRDYVAQRIDPNKRRFAEAYYRTHQKFELSDLLDLDA